MSASARKSRLSGAMKQKTTVDEPQPADEQKVTPALTLAPTPTEAVADEPASEEGEPTVALDVSEMLAEETASRPVDSVDGNDEVEEVSPVDEELLASYLKGVEAVDDGPEDPADDRPAEPTAASRRAPADTAKPLVQTARVLAGTGQIDLDERPLTHLRKIMETGRDQRRYVEDLPRRSDKGTYLRLPVHLQDVLAQYCDRNDAPMADFVAAVLDGYFRDLGLLPPLGQGHRPNEKLLDKIRKESRTYDY